jgi:hypothetical protein
MAQGDSGEYLMGLPGKAFEHAQAICAITGLAKDIRADCDSRI